MLKVHRIARGILEGNLRGTPYRLNLAVTNLCDSRCKTCDIWQIYPRGALDVRQELRTGEWEQIFQKLPPSVMWLSFSGGEPHLRSDFAELMQACFALVPNLAMVNVPNNGIKRERALRNWEKILAARERPFVYISVSVDGPREVHDEVRGVAGNFESAMQLVDDLRRLIAQEGNAALGVGLTVSKFNCEHAVAFARECVERGLKVKVEAAYSGELYYQGLTGPRPSLEALGVREAIRQISALLSERQWKRSSPSDWLERQHVRGTLKYLDEPGRMVVPCRAARSSYAFDCYGNVTPCFFYPRALGNVRDFQYDLMALVRAHSAEVGGARRAIDAGECPKCWLVCNSIDSMIDQRLRRPWRGV